MTMFVIQQISTKLFMPTYKGGQRRGTTYITPKEFSKTPRIFSRQQDARGVLRQWLAGQLRPKFAIIDDWGNEEYAGCKVVHQTNRDPNDYLVVEVEIVIKQENLL